jgi:hypothetical protein
VARLFRSRADKRGSPPWGGPAYRRGKEPPFGRQLS